MPDANGNGELTRAVLRAEIRAARAEDRETLTRMLDDRLKPVNEHIAAIDRGELSPGLRAGILTVVEEKHKGTWLLRSNKAALISVIVVVASFATNTALAISHF